MKEREKFRVARVERKRPRRRREKDFMRRKCWGIASVLVEVVEGMWWVKRAARVRGRRMSAMMQV